MGESFNWTCPHCQFPQTGSDTNTHESWTKGYVGSSEFGEFGIGWFAIACLNKACQKVTFRARFTKAVNKQGSWSEGPTTHDWPLLPESAGKPQPPYIPLAIRNDYAEACRIRDLSPKASATLARRCLQGMIRDFAKIAKARLIDEINALREQLDNGSAPAGVTPESIEAIDDVRKIGNIGAHMEKDVDLIVDIEPGEAQALIELIEMLFDEWYVARFQRKERLSRIAAVAEEKQLAIEEAKNKNKQ